MDKAMIALSTKTGTGTLHVRAWHVPPDLAATFASWMTGWFGKPDEMISDAETMNAGAEQAAAEGRAIFLLNAEGGSDG